jgi:hypothetical protein
MRDFPDDIACNFNPFFLYIREVKRRALASLEAGEEPSAIRRSIRGRIGAGERDRPGPTLDRLRAVATLGLDAVLPPDDRSAEVAPGGPRSLAIGDASSFRWSRG